MTETYSHKNNGLSISIKNLEKQFSNQKIIDGLNLEIKKGEFVSIVGHSGSGKSTFLRLISGIESPTAGTLTINQNDPNLYKKDIRLMFQEPRLLPWKSITRNISIGLKKNWEDKALSTLKAVGLANKGNCWPATLSGGQKQRAALARALIHAPKLLLLDEPLGALDALTRIEMQRLIEDLWLERQFTVLLVTHDINEAVSLGDRVVLIEHGKIALNQEIKAPRPRQKNDADLIELEQRILQRIFTPNNAR